MLTKTKPDAETWRDFFFTSEDGLRIHARDYGSRLAEATPLLCLPGLTRNAKDFHRLACYFASHASRPRRVVCLDYRGRGLSDYDTNWKNYTPQVEVRDVFDALSACGLKDVAIIGASRGGILAMLMAVIRPALLAGVVLNDVGPVLGAKGLARIKGYVGKVPPVRDWQDAANLMHQMNQHHFPHTDEEAWLNFAKNIFVEKDGIITPDYDVKLAKQLANLNLSATLPTLWPQFDALRNIPTMVIRGANSDLLEEETLMEMKKHHPDMEMHEVKDAGHAPFLDDEPTLKKIASFLGKLDH